MNLEHAQYLAQKQGLTTKLVDLERKMAAINAEIAELSGTGVERILEAIKNQRWYFFRNKTKVFMDRDTGLLWANLNCFPYGENNNTSTYPYNNESKINKVISSYDFEMDVTFRISTCYEFWDVIADETFPFRLSKDYYGPNDFRYWLVRYGELIQQKDTCYAGATDQLGYSNGFLLPCSDTLVLNSGYGNTVPPNNPDFHEKEQLQSLLDLFVQNNLWPIFEEDEITELFNKIYIEKPKLIEQLQAIQTQIKEIQAVTLLSSEFDYTVLLSKYDVDAVDNSMVKYYKAVQQWCSELLDKLDFYEKEKAVVIHEYDLIRVKLSKEYDVDSNFTDEENDLFRDRQKFFQKKYIINMNEIKKKILTYKKQADLLEDRIDAIDDSIHSIHELAELEQESRVSFSHLAENTAKIITNALLKIEFFEENEVFIKNAFNLLEEWLEEYRVFKTIYKDDMKKDCESDKIEEAVWDKWYYEWQEIRFLLEKKMQLIFEYVARRQSLIFTDEGDNVAELLLNLLHEFKQQIDNFYIEERKNLYCQYNAESNGELKSRVEVEKRMFEYITYFRVSLHQILLKCSDAEVSIWIQNWAGSILTYQTDNITRQISQEQIWRSSELVLEGITNLKKRERKLDLLDKEKWSSQKKEIEELFHSLIEEMEQLLSYEEPTD